MHRHMYRHVYGHVCSAAVEINMKEYFAMLKDLGLIGSKYSRALLPSYLTLSIRFMSSLMSICTS